MKPETVERILRTADAEIQRTGEFKNWDEAMKFAKVALNAPDGVLPFTAAGSSDRLYTRSELRDIFLAQPEPTPRQLEAAINGLKQFAGDLRREFLKDVKKIIPADRGGRHSVLGTPARQEELVDQVLALIRLKVRTTIALKRVAQRAGISLSSMQRIWRMRERSDDSDEI